MGVFKRLVQLGAVAAGSVVFVASNTEFQALSARYERLSHPVDASGLAHMQLPMERELPGGTSSADRGADGASACPVIGSGKDGGMQTAGLLQQISRSLAENNWGGGAAGGASGDSSFASGDSSCPVIDTRGGPLPANAVGFEKGEPVFATPEQMLERELWTLRWQFPEKRDGRRLVVPADVVHQKKQIKEELKNLRKQGAAAAAGRRD